jgi:dienelactone hydrolase
MDHFPWLRVPAVAVWCLSAFGQAPQEKQTIVNPLPDEEILQPCEYRMLVPETKGPIRAAWVIFDRGQDYLQWFHDRRVRGFASEHHLALVLAAHCRSKEREDMIVLPEKGVGRALFSALDQFADSENRPELRTTGIIAMGWSGAGSLAARLAGYRPKRYVAVIAYAPGQYEPLGMDTIDLPAQALSSPQLIIANGGDNINGTERPYEYFKKYYEKGAPWTFVVQNRTPHCCLQNAQTLILEWLRAVLLAKDSRRLGEGDQGYITIEPAEVVDEWKRPVFNAKSTRIGPKGKRSRGEVPSGWMPSAMFSREWLTFTGRPAPVAVWKP